MHQDIVESQRNIYEPGENCFTLQGSHHFEDEDGNFRLIEQYDKRGNRIDFREHRQAYAIEKVMPSMIKYFVMSDTTGQLFDPRNVDHLQTAMTVRNGNKIWRWVTISKNGFEFYKDYLKRNNKVFYAKAKTALSNPGG